MPVYNISKSRAEYLNEVLTKHPARQDVPLITRTLWGEPRSFAVNANVLIGVRAMPNKWLFWWLNPDGDLEPDETNPFKDLESVFDAIPELYSNLKIALKLIEESKLSEKDKGKIISIKKAIHKAEKLIS